MAKTQNFSESDTAYRNLDISSATTVLVNLSTVFAVPAIVLDYLHTVYSFQNRALITVAHIIVKNR